MFDRCRRLGFGALKALAFWLVCGALLASPPAAAQYNVYEVVVPIDVTAKSAAAAKTEALAEGEQRAFARLLERLTLFDDRDRLPKLGGKGIATLVQDISVADEKTSGVRYLAELTVRFKRREVRKLLIDLGIPFAETRSKPVLVLPVYQAAGALMLFDDPNPWREAWSGLAERGNLVPLILPEGDLTDIAAVGPEQAVQGDRQRLAAIARRYQAGSTMVAFARLGMDFQISRSRVETTLTRYGTSAQSGVATQSRTERHFLTAEKGETPQGLLNRTAKLMARLIEDQWKRDNLLQFDRTGVAAVAVPIADLKTWIWIRRRLNRVSVIRRLDLVLMSRDEVRVNLHYIGDLEQLVLALEQADLNLSRDGDNWILKPQKPLQGRDQSQKNVGAR